MMELLMKLSSGHVMKTEMSPHSRTIQDSIVKFYLLTPNRNRHNLQSLAMIAPHQVLPLAILALIQLPRPVTTVMVNLLLRPYRHHRPHHQPILKMEVEILATIVILNPPPTLRRNHKKEEERLGILAVLRPDRGTQRDRDCFCRGQICNPAKYILPYAKQDIEV